jgi:hypothetical protein
MALVRWARRPWEIGKSPGVNLRAARGWLLGNRFLYCRFRNRAMPCGK